MASSVNDNFVVRNKESQSTFAGRQAEDTRRAAQQTAEAAQTAQTRQTQDEQRAGQMKTEAAGTAQKWNAEAQSQYDTRMAGAEQGKAQRLGELDTEFNRRNTEGAAKIEDLYGKGLASEKQRLKTGLDNSMAAQEEARSDIARTYQASANDLSAQFERMRRNANLQAMASGLNSGTGSQQQNALGTGYLRSYGQLRGEESARNAAIDREIANLKTQYENDISQAIADNDYKKTAALLDDYSRNMAYKDQERRDINSWFDQQSMYNLNRLDSQSDQSRSFLNAANMNADNFLINQTNQNRNFLDNANMNIRNNLENNQRANRSEYDTERARNRSYQDTERTNEQNRGLERAKTLASFGDFSGFAELYGPETAAGLQRMWYAQNPDLAWRYGAIDAETYRFMTGEYPAGYTPAGGGDAGGTWYPWMGGGPGNNDTGFGPPDTSGNNGQAALNALASATTRGEVARAAEAARDSGAINAAQYDAVQSTIH